MSNYIGLHHENDEKGLTSNEVETGQEFVSKSLIKNPLLIEFINFSHHQNDKKQQAIAYQDKQRLRKFSIYNAVLVTLTILAVSFAWLAIISEQKAVTSEKLAIASEQKAVASEKLVVASQNETKLALKESEHNYALLLQDSAKDARENKDFEKARHLAIAALAKGKSLNELTEAQHIVAKFGIESRFIKNLKNRANRSFSSKNNVFDAKKNKVAKVTLANQILVINYDLNNTTALIGHRANVLDVKFHPNRPNLLYSLGEGGEFIVWDIRKEKAIFKCVLNKKLTSFNFSFNSRFLTIFSKTGSSIWDVSEDLPVLFNEFETEFIFNDISGDGELLVAKNTNGKFIIYNLEKEEITYQLENFENVTSNILFTSNNNIVYAKKEQVIFLNLAEETEQIVQYKNVNITELKRGSRSDKLYLLVDRGLFSGLTIKDKKGFSVSNARIKSKNVVIDGEIIYYLNETENTIYTAYKPSHYYADVFVKSHNERFFAVAIGADVEVWDLDTGTFNVIEGESSRVHKIAFTADNQVVVMYRSRKITRSNLNGVSKVIIPQEKLPKATGHHHILASGKYYLIFDPKTNNIHVTNLNTLINYVYKLPPGSIHSNRLDVNRENNVSFKITDKKLETWYDLDLEKRKLKTLFNQNVNIENVTHSKSGNLIAGYIFENGHKNIVVFDKQLNELQRLKLDEGVITGAKLKFTFDNQFLIDEDIRLRWKVGTDSYSKNSLGSHKYQTLQSQGVVLGFQGEAINVYRFDDKPISKPSPDYHRATYQGLTFTKYDIDTVNDKAKDISALNYLKSSNNKYQITEYLNTSSSASTVILKNMILNQSHTLNLKQYTRGDIQQAKLSKDRLKVILYYLEGYLIYNLKNHKSAFYENHHNNTPMGSLFSEDSKYALIVRFGSTLPYDFINLEEPSDGNKPSFNALDTNTNLLQVRYQPIKSLFFFKYSDRNEIYLYNTSNRQTYQLEHNFEVQDFHISTDKDYLMVITKNKKQVTLFIKPYLMNKKQWDEVYLKFGESSRNDLFKTSLRAKREL